MLFNSYVFIFLFLPFTLVGFYALAGRFDRRIAIGWLVAASLFFYAWWNPVYLALLLLSIGANFTLGRLVLPGAGARRVRLILGIAFNLGLLGWFKYANFFVDTINHVAETSLVLHQIVLPLAISFFTFQQVAYLVDAYRGLTRDHGFLDYCLFVSFFPQLIAGPIVHHEEMLPQFGRDETYRPDASNLAVGATIFAIGLFKKVVLADGIAVYANPAFDGAAIGLQTGLFEAWTGTLAYTLQLYFDFSGYSDMAIGLGRLFGIRLPVNFDSPYRSVNIIEFWRRWHMTLSRFLRDYLYIPLGGNRLGRRRRYINLMLTMLVGGLWHGAGWTFVAWGALHGLYLVINHGFHALRRALGWREGTVGALGPWIARGFTMLAVTLAWVFFRAESFESASLVLRGLLGLHGLDTASTLSVVDAAPWILALGTIALLAPNSNEIMAEYNRPLGWQAREPSLLLPRFRWHPTPLYAAIMGLLVVIAVLGIGRANEFLYFRF